MKKVNVKNIGNLVTPAMKKSFKNGVAGKTKSVVIMTAITTAVYLMTDK